MSQLFLTTHWTRILASRGETPEAKNALSDLCGAYYTPVLTFLRQSGYDEDTARDLAHEFFGNLLQRHGLEGADPARGRFRTYLLGAVKHFVWKQHAAADRKKRGGGVAHEPLGVASDTSPGLDVADPSSVPPDKVFDREWAVNVLDRALRVLARESEKAGNGRQFAVLKAWLTGAQSDLSQTEAAKTLDMTEGALRVAIHRLRRRFRELVKAEISQTVSNPIEVNEELRHLIEVMG